jgi:hypothetical protein
MDPLTITGVVVGTAVGALVIGGIGSAVIRNKPMKRKVRFSNYTSNNNSITTRRVSTSIPRGKRSRRLSSIAEGKGRSRKSKK